MKCFITLKTDTKAYKATFQSETATDVTITDVLQMEDGEEWIEQGDMSVLKSQIGYWFKGESEPLM